jgi:hypothetical protein
MNSVGRLSAACSFQWIVSGGMIRHLLSLGSNHSHTSSFVDRSTRNFVRTTSDWLQHFFHWTRSRSAVDVRVLVPLVVRVPDVWIVSSRHSQREDEADDAGGLCRVRAVGERERRRSEQSCPSECLGRSTRQQARAHQLGCIARQSKVCRRERPRSWPRKTMLGHAFSNKIPPLNEMYPELHCIGLPPAICLCSCAGAACWFVAAYASRSLGGAAIVGATDANPTPSIINPMKALLISSSRVSLSRSPASATHPCKLVTRVATFFDSDATPHPLR